MLKKANEPDFDPERSAFFMPSGCGPCRFGQYNTAQRMVLDRAGLSRVPIYAPMQDVEFYEELGMIGKDFSRISWENVIAFDLLVKCLHETRPYEANPGETDGVYAKHLKRMRECLAAPDRDPVALLKDVRREFEQIETTGETRPLIGVVGEIFVRSNRFSNEDAVRKIEKLGGEAWLAPIDEWFFYTNAMALRRALKKGEYKRWLKLKLKNHFQHKIAHEMERIFDGMLKTIHDPDTYEVMENAEPYIDDSLEGEAILSIGKSVDMISRGCVGIVNLMPFGCMPGTVVTALMRRISQEYGVPSISLPFDGTDSPANRLQLEAFMEQCARRVRERESEIDLSALDN
jgi:predicted nucleotide-binding protein (sugar kinase/HSP70/actin superfamily)